MTVFFQGMCVPLTGVFSVYNSIRKNVISHFQRRLALNLSSFQVETHSLIVFDLTFLIKYAMHALYQYILCWAKHYGS